MYEASGAWALLALSYNAVMKETVVILDNIRSAHNVGSIFRTADAAGVERIYLCGITPAPTDRFGRRNAEIKKTSLGAAETVTWEQVGDGTNLATEKMLALIEELKQAGFTIVAVEQCPDSIPLFELKVPEKVAYIFGAEVEGVQPEVLAVADTKVEIPMKGQKESLNVSVTAGIVLFQKP